MAGRGRPRKDTNRLPHLRPIRTREHIIADLSVLHFQWVVTRSGYITTTPEHDYGYDMLVFTLSDSGQFETGFIFAQLKATDRLGDLLFGDGRTISVPIEKRHLDLWQNEPAPVILVLFDAQKETAYWLYVQRYLEENRISVSTDQAAVSLHIPVDNVLTEAAIRQFRQFKINAWRRMRGTSVHGNETDL